jgi:hypothetical protein
MGYPCDGGGNRYLSEISITNAEHSELSAIYPHLKALPVGVCSIQPNALTSPWVVCPRRLYVTPRASHLEESLSNVIEQRILSLVGYPFGTKVGIWREVKLKFEEKSDENADDPLTRFFDYTFDYVFVPLHNITLSVAADKLRLPLQHTRRLLIENEFRVTEAAVEDFPFEPPTIIEVMTSSTSGGNKRKRTGIAQCFEDAILARPHRAPGINYRQVWARMASQLIAKSEIALAWGGKAIWIVQDNLVNYISATTRLDIRQFRQETLDEVNILSFGYQDSAISTSSTLYAGPIGARTSHESGAFLDIVRLSASPSLGRFLFSLIKKGQPSAIIHRQEDGA